MSSNAYGHTTVDRKRAGIDLDGVVYRWTDTARFLLNYYWGFSLGESTSWTYIQDNISPEAWAWLWKDGVEKHGLFRHGNCYPGAFEALNAIDRKGYDLILITSRPANARFDTYDWIGYHRIPAKAVHIIGHTTLKSTVLPLCDWYVDDRPENILDLETTGRPAFLLDRPWNQGAAVQRRVMNWQGILEAIE